mgnify:CR=1 FL=1
MVDAALSKYGRLDILVNNAGIFDELIPVGEVSDDLWYKVMETNLNAPMRGIRKVIPIFEKQGGGVIVNTASIAGLLEHVVVEQLCSFQTCFNRINQKCGVQL